ncbi:MAG TPA: alkaline phosphatase D family protein [Gemmatimonadales bacterium]|nr:alkaline phosphatase D family protein [Gemmatimonadales bacterium]
MNRREFVAIAAALGASAAWARRLPAASRVSWQERRDLFPEGVASGDPQANSVLLWTRYPAAGRRTTRLTLEVAEDVSFERVVVSSFATLTADADWTCRVLVNGLEPGRVYWYRFTDAAGMGSRVGRTITAPADDDPRPVRFAFVSCQNANQGVQTAYRRMIYEDERAAGPDQLFFVLHLGDFIYEIVWYPEDRPQGYYDRRIRDIVRYQSGEKINDFHIPTTVEDYRAVYRAYLHDPDLQDARARWPFVAMWDNHEFSWQGWQGIQQFGGTVRPAQTKKVAANQAWFEYQPARVVKPGGPSLERFEAPLVADTPVLEFDEHGLGQEANNLRAIASLTGYRALRFGRNVDLLITDQHSYRSEDPTGRPEARPFSSPDFPQFFPEEALEILDAGRTYDGGRAPESIRFGETVVPNFRKDQPPQTILGAEQKAWFLKRLKKSTATWKVWGNSLGTLDWRADPQNIPEGIARPWPGGYAGFGGGDYGSAFVERGEIYDFVKEEGITGFATVAGDRHSFWAGLAAKALPPRRFDPVGIAFITGSISAPGIVEALEHNLAPSHPLRPLFLQEHAGSGHPEPAINLLMHRGAKACFEYQKTGSIERARALTNPDLAPHLSFIDMGGHGYAAVRATRDAFETEFVCIPRPVEPSDRPDGAPLLYRVSHRARLWKKGQTPVLEQRVLEGNPSLSI